MKKILLFYKYIPVNDPWKIRDWQHDLCQTLKLKGRIILGKEGINGTLSGDVEQVQAYISAMHTHALFYDIDFKESIAPIDVFPKLKVKVREEIVTSGLNKSKLSDKQTGEYLEPTAVNKLIEEHKKDLVILDARNEIEWRVGRFKNAITPNIKHFRELATFIDKHENTFKDKNVLMYCTGGIRCELASSYLKSKGIAKKVYQIEGGIHRYVEAYPDGYFRGKNYVFDGRVTTKVNTDVLSTCELCHTTCDDITNCINTRCNKHFICCSTCIEKYQNTCQPICLELILSAKTPIRFKPARMIR